MKAVRNVNQKWFKKQFSYFWEDFFRFGAVFFEIEFFILFLIYLFLRATGEIPESSEENLLIGALAAFISSFIGMGGFAIYKWERINRVVAAAINFLFLYLPVLGFALWGKLLPLEKTLHASVVSLALFVVFLSIRSIAGNNRKE